MCSLVGKEVSLQKRLNYLTDNLVPERVKSERVIYLFDGV